MSNSKQIFKYICQAIWYLSRPTSNDQLTKNLKLKQEMINILISSFVAVTQIQKTMADSLISLQDLLVTNLQEYNQTKKTSQKFLLLATKDQKRITMSWDFQIRDIKTTFVETKNIFESFAEKKIEKCMKEIREVQLPADKKGLMTSMLDAIVE